MNEERVGVAEAPRNNRVGACLQRLDENVEDDDGLFRFGFKGSLLSFRQRLIFPLPLPCVLANRVGLGSARDVGEGSSWSEIGQFEHVKWG